MKKNIGIKLFALYYLIFGILNMVLGFLSLSNESISNLSQQDFIVFIYAFGIAPFLIIIGVGLFLLREWARKGFILIAVIKIAFTVFKTTILYNLTSDKVLGVVIGICLTSIIHGFMIYYFVQPKIKEQFK